MNRRSGRYALVVCLFFAFVVASPAANALTGTEACFFNSLNNERSKVGRPKLVLKSDLVSVARKHSDRMAADGTIYHNGNLKNEVGGDWWALGENVGMGPTCESIHDAFMASEGHRANILDKDYNQIGVGVTIREGTIYITEVFAGRSGSAPPKKVAPKPAPIAAKPAPKPAPKPAVAAPRTVGVLLSLLGMDMKRVNPRNGLALGV